MATSVCALLVCAMALSAILPAVHGRQVHSTKPETTTFSSAAVSPAVAQERALRRAVANAAESPVTFTLTTDIVLTAPLPDLQPYTRVRIIGKCKDRNGKPRSCSINGARQPALFTGIFLCAIYLERLVIHNISGNVHYGRCDLSARYVVFRGNVGLSGVVLRTAFLGDGGVFNVGSTFRNNRTPMKGSTLNFANCTFRNNRAPSGFGGAIYAEENILIFRDVVFQGNSAESGGAIMTSATNFTSIRTAFLANTASDGQGGAIVVFWDHKIGTYKFCRSTFRGNVANPSRYRSSDNIAFFTGVFRAPIAFCPGPAPSGIIAPTFLSLKYSCTGCSGCEGDCNGRGQCLLASDFAWQYCRCSAFFDTSSSCTKCLKGYTRQSNCKECSAAYYHPPSNPATCKLCPGLSQVLEGKYNVGWIKNVTSAIGPQQCQTFCKAAKLRSNGNVNKYCNMWIYTAKRMGSPTACAGKCLLLSQSEYCGVYPIENGPYGIYYQYLELNNKVCGDN